jgi:hypothetical protein
MTGYKIPDQSKFPIIDPETIQSFSGPFNPVLVIGMHNSGTSILTEILHSSGIFFCANMRHHESLFFTSFINNRLIFRGGGNWAKLPIMSEGEVLSFEKTVGPIIQKYWLVDYLQWGYDGKSPWGIKDPRLCVLIPLYLKLFPKARVIHITRKPEDIAASLTTKYKEGVGILDDFDHWIALTEAYTERVHKYSSQCDTYFELAYEDFVTQTNEITQQLFEVLSLPFTPSTEQLLTKVTPTRVGSYQRLQEAQKHPWRSRLRSFFQR